MTAIDLISRYAPSSENKTGAYAAHVAEIAGVAVDQYIDLTDRDNMRNVVTGIIQHENGMQPYTWELEDGITLA